VECTSSQNATSIFFVFENDLTLKLNQLQNPVIGIFFNSFNLISKIVQINEFMANLCKVPIHHCIFGFKWMHYHIFFPSA
jgi:hypothetical protein